MSYVSHARRRELAWLRANLPPLEPDGFMRWAWGREDGTHPVTLDDVAFELGEEPSSLRPLYVRIAARVRRNIRLGLDPWEGI